MQARFRRPPALLTAIFLVTASLGDSLTGGAVATAGAVSLAIPQFVQAGGGQMVPMLLPGGRVALLRADGDRVVVDQVAAPPAVSEPGPVDLRPGDVIGKFQGLVMPSLADLNAALAAVAAGEQVQLEAVRGGLSIPLTYTSPGPAMVMSRAAGAAAPPPVAVTGGGSWTQGPDGEAATGFAVAADVSPADLSRALLAEQVRAGDPGVSLAVARGGEIVLAQAAGMARVADAVPMTVDSLLPAASVTKTFTAFAIATLAVQGRLSLDDDIRRFLPEMHAFDPPITIAHLLHHTSGIKDYSGLLSFTGWSFGDVVSSAQLMTLMSRQREVYTLPGEQHRYSNSNYFLLAEIVARVSGRSFPEAVREMALDPAHLSRTTIPADGEVVAGTASTYRASDTTFAEVASSEGPPGAGGMLATPSDLVAWGTAFAAGRLGAPEVATLMQQTPTLTDGTELSYALGLGTSEFRGRRRLGHSGSSPGSGSVLHVYPDDDLAIAVMANRDDVDVYEIAEAIAASFLPPPATASTEAGGNVGSGLPRGAFMITDEDMEGDASVPLLDASAARYAGRYALEDDREWVIAFDQGRLLLQLQDDLGGVQLVPLDGGRFLFRPARWEISFTEGEDGNVDGIVLHYMENSVRRGEPRDVPGTRITVQPPTAAERKALTGDYLSDELGVMYTILEADGRLWLENARLGRLPMSHFTGDVFGMPGRAVVRVEFHRVATGEVVGLRAAAYAWGTTTEFRRLR